MSEAGTFGGSRVSVRTLARSGGIALSVALVLGGAVWGWRLTERNVEGVPIIRAAEGPMRIAPEEPGGDLAEHQGLSVSRIAAGAAATPPPPELRLAPRVLGLAAEDMPQPPEPEMPEIAATDRAVAEALGLDTATLIRARATSASGPAPRPETRAAPARTRIPGDGLVQLGAFPQEDAAATAWRGLLRRFPDLLEGTDRHIERVERDSRTFWRLRAGGFADLADARRVCAALTAGDAECIPVVRR